MQRRMLRAVLQGLAATENPFDFVRIEQVRSWIGAGDKRLQVLGAGLTGQGCGTRYILRRGRRPPVARCLDIPGALVLREYGVKIRVQVVSPEHFDKAQLGGAQVALDADRLGERCKCAACGRAIASSRRAWKGTKTERLSHRRQVAENLARRSAGADPGRGNSLGRAFAL